MKTPATAENGGADVKAKSNSEPAHHSVLPSHPQAPAQKQPPPAPAPDAAVAEGAL